MTEVKTGDRVKLLSTNDPYTDLKREYIGVVQEIVRVGDGSDSFTQIWVKWDNGSNFALVPETGDMFEVVSK